MRAGRVRSAELKVGRYIYQLQERAEKCGAASLPDFRAERV
jgi:hypothetical protein